MKVFYYLPFAATNALDFLHSTVNFSACALTNVNPFEKIDSICGNNACRDQVLGQLQDSNSEEDFNLKYDKYKDYCERLGYDWGLRFVDKLTQTSTMKAKMNGIMEYGCWCNLASGFKKGRGTPVNELDAVCRNVNLNTRCIDLDAKVGNYTCNPYEINFFPAFMGLSTDAAELESQCQDVNDLLYDENDNPNDKACAIRTCVVSTYLVSALAEFSLTVGYKYEPEYVHIGRTYEDADDKEQDGTFDFEKNCPSMDYSTGPKNCCGLYPYRHEYRTDLKECCVEKEGGYGREIFSIKRCGQCDPRGADYESERECEIIV